jgi:transcriptional regulator with XRE-family HTH domain
VPGSIIGSDTTRVGYHRAIAQARQAAGRAGSRGKRAKEPADVGMRLRGERERRGLSLRELARRLELSASALSQIETGRSRPSVSTLYAIVSELGMSLDELFGAGNGQRPAAEARSEASPVQRVELRKRLELESGVRWERLTAAPDPDVDFFFLEYEVGGSSSSGGLMRHSGSEYGLVLRGRLTITVGFEEHELGPGDSISFDSTVPHRLVNTGDEPVEAVWFIVGRDPAR